MSNRTIEVKKGGEAKGECSKHTFAINYFRKIQHKKRRKCVEMNEPDRMQAEISLQQTYFQQTSHTHTRSPTLTPPRIQTQTQEHRCWFVIIIPRLAWGVSGERRNECFGLVSISIFKSGFYSYGIFVFTRIDHSAVIHESKRAILKAIDKIWLVEIRSSRVRGHPIECAQHTHTHTHDCSAPRSSTRYFMMIAVAKHACLNLSFHPSVDRPTSTFT